MPWDAKAVEAPASTVKTPLASIPDDVATGVEEAFEYVTANPTERIVITFDTEDERDLTRALVRSYCEVRPKGRITASIWAVTANPETGETTTEDGAKPALSMSFRKYVKKSAQKNGNESGNEKK